MHGMKAWNQAESWQIGQDSLKMKRQVAPQRVISIRAMVWYGLKRAVRRVADKKG